MGLTLAKCPCRESICTYRLYVHMKCVNPEQSKKIRHLRDAYFHCPKSEQNTYFEKLKEAEKELVDQYRKLYSDIEIDSEKYCGKYIIGGPEAYICDNIISQYTGHNFHQFIDNRRHNYRGYDDDSSGVYVTRCKPCMKKLLSKINKPDFLVFQLVENKEGFQEK